MSHFFTDYVRQAEARFMENVNWEIRMLVEDLKRENRKMSWDTYEGLQMNSYERKYVYDYLDDDALIKLTELCIKNSQYGRPLGRFTLADQYDHAIIGELVPRLLKRLKELKP